MWRQNHSVEIGPESLYSIKAPIWYEFKLNHLIRTFRSWFIKRLLVKRFEFLKNRSKRPSHKCSWQWQQKCHKIMSGNLEMSDFWTLLHWAVDLRFWIIRSLKVSDQWVKVQFQRLNKKRQRKIRIAQLRFGTCSSLTRREKIINETENSIRVAEPNWCAIKRWCMDEF